MPPCFRWGPAEGISRPGRPTKTTKQHGAGGSRRHVQEAERLAAAAAAAAAERRRRASVTAGTIAQAPPDPHAPVGDSHPHPQRPLAPRREARHACQASTGRAQTPGITRSASSVPLRAHLRPAAAPLPPLCCSSRCWVDLTDPQSLHYRTLVDGATLACLGLASPGGVPAGAAQQALACHASRCFRIDMPTAPHTCVPFGASQCSHQVQSAVRSVSTVTGGGLLVRGLSSASAPQLARLQRRHLLGAQPLQQVSHLGQLARSLQRHCSG